MVNNPYEVLGVTPDATDEQIKTAYRNLAKKYHPDKYVNSPLKDVADEKMKEINEAYDTIVEMRKNQTSSSAGAGQSYNSYNANQNPIFNRVRSYIMAGNLEGAEQMLDGVSEFDRNAEWYFLKGMIYTRKGWSEQAFQHLQRAVKLDPTNPEYNAAYNNMLNSRRYGASAGYDQPNNTYGCNCLDMCIGTLCLNACCNCCGGGC